MPKGKYLADIRLERLRQIPKVNGCGGIAILRGGKVGMRLEKSVHLRRICIEKAGVLGGYVGIHLRYGHCRLDPAPHERREAVLHCEILESVVRNMPGLSKTGILAKTDIDRKARHGAGAVKEKIGRRVNDARLEFVCAL